jgi:SagB-type dehydrogenase family enzyme
VRTPGPKPRRGAASPTFFARLGRWARVEAHASGAIVAVFEADSVMLGRFGASAAACLQDLRVGLPLGSLTSAGGNTDKEIDLLFRRLIGHGLLEYCIRNPGNGGEDLVVIEPQIPGYAPQIVPIADSDTLVLSRFAYLRRRGKEMVLESPRSAALFKVCDPKLASLVAALAAPQQVRHLRQQDGFPGMDFLALLVDGQMVLKTDPARESNSRLAEGDHDLALWDFHDLLFHARSTEGRHANLAGGVYPHGGAIPQLPVMRPPWPGKTIDLCGALASRQEPPPPVAKLFRETRSTRSFDDRHPITLPELSCFLDGAARGLPRPGSPEPIARPFPSAGASSELELYLAVHVCEGLAPGFYHYDAGAHALVAIEVQSADIKALLAHGASAMGVTAPPQILMTIAARFGRVSWKYSSIAYALILKDAGVLTETLYLMACGMGLGGCAIGIANIDQFEKMTGIGFHVEGPVGQFALGRPLPPAGSQ